jgi:hypothetical protein
MAKTIDLYLDQGSDFTTEIEARSIDGSTINLLGALVYSQFRKSYGSPTAFSLDAQVSNADNGKISLSLLGTASSNVKAGRYVYDVEVILSNSSKIRVAEGILTISAEITKI